MANWYGTCRSNYFAVRDVEAFKEMLPKYEATFIVNNDGLVGFISNNESGSFPQYWDEATDEDSSIVDEIAPHLAENQVCVIQEVGAEKARYLTGKAFAIAWTGETILLTIDDIYALAQSEFGSDAKITEAIY